MKTVNTVQAPLLTAKAVDRAVNALFNAVTTDLGRPFVAGSRNVRQVVRTWCPLSQEALPAVDVATFKRDYITAHFFDRYFYADEVKSSAVSLEQNAHQDFLKICDIGRGFSEQLSAASTFSWRDSIIASASLEVARILGEFSTEDFFESCQHGPNATIGVKKEDSYHHNKVVSFDGTLPCLRLLSDYLDWNFQLGDYIRPLLLAGRVQLQPQVGNRLSFVPKSFEKLRTMMVEPTVNQFFQQGFGIYMRNRLRDHGNIDLENQDASHRLLVRCITANNLKLATIDWSGASDRIWLELCHRLLPSDWYAALETIRSPVALYKGSVVSLPMAGSMGCGYTFPLQTLVFATILRALAREAGLEQFVTVFGDDCIVDVELIPHVQAFADLVGWKLNLSKSHWEGGFRESCGEDSYHGVNCRPFFIKRPSDVTNRDALSSWAIGCYNRAVQATGLYGYTPNCNDWLINFLSSVCDRRANVVPFRFSEEAGVRALCPTDFAGTPFVQPRVVTSSRPYREHVQGFTFQYIGSKKLTVGAEVEPYYLLKLEGKGVPQDFRKTQVCLDESEAQVGMCPEGRVPWKGNRRKTKRGYVHTWHYFI